MQARPAPGSPLLHWSGWLPIAISLFILSLAIRYIAIYGLVRQADEGIEAHLFQLLMPVQLLLVVVFAFIWLPRTPRALPVLALQLVSAASVFGMVYWIEHAV